VAAGLVYMRAVAQPARRLGASLAPDPRTLRTLARVGADLMVRTAALRASFIGATVIASRLGKAEVAAHQICVEIWNLLALGLDALAIAAQAMIGRLLGAGRPGEARDASRRLLRLGVLAGVALTGLVLVLRPVLPGVFTDDAEVQRLCGFLLLWVAAQQPLAAVVFVLDGVLIGAGDQRFLAAAMVVAGAAFFAAALPILPLGLGIGWIWAAISVLLVVRVAALAARFAGDRWQVLGAHR
jgi:putative MATE family efflux protein